MRYIYPFFSALFRDAFGKNGYYIPLLKSRFVQHVIAFAMTFLLCYFDKGLKWWWCIWIATWLQIWWSLGHVSYDLAKKGIPTGKELERYKKSVGYKFLCKIFDEKDWYGIGFDFCLLTIRYTYPLFAIVWWFNPVLLSLGLVIASLYLIYRYCPYCQKHRWTDVELYSGFFCGLYIAFL